MNKRNWKLSEFGWEFKKEGYQCRKLAKKLGKAQVVSNLQKTQSFPFYLPNTLQKFTRYDENLFRTKIYEQKSKDVVLIFAITDKNQTSNICPGIRYLDPFTFVEETVTELVQDFGI